MARPKTMPGEWAACVIAVLWIVAIAALGLWGAR